MKNKILHNLRVFLVLVVAALIFLPFLKNLALKQVKGNYLRESVQIKDFKVSKSNSDLSAKLAVVIDNSGDMILDRINLKINYLNSLKQSISSDEVDLLKMAKDVVLAHSQKSFIIDVTVPGNCRFIIPQIIR